MKIPWSYNLGVWIWGALLIIWLVFAVLAFLPQVPWSSNFSSHDSLAAAITAVLGVIWSWFLKLDSEQP